jgi:hypothetical protein
MLEQKSKDALALLLAALHAKASSAAKDALMPLVVEAISHLRIALQESSTRVQAARVILEMAKLIR